MTGKVGKKIPPDGGWGWVIVFGSSMINLSTRAIEPSFGLLFGDLLRDLGVATTGASVVVSTLDAIINFSGLFVGPLIKRLTYRKVAIAGAILSSASLLLTSYADSMLHIIVTFSCLGGVGFGLATACTLVGINSYFAKKKGQAVGLAMAGTALGFMAMPQIVSLLLSEYDFRSAMLILGALSLHALVGATLFQPVEWHLRSVVPVIDEEKKEDKEASVKLLTPFDRKHSIPVNITSGESKTSPDLRIGKLLKYTLMERAASTNHIYGSCTNFRTELLKGNTDTLSRQLSGPTLNIQNVSKSPDYLAAPVLEKSRKVSTISNVSLVDLTGSSVHIEYERGIYEEDEDGNGLDIKASENDVENGGVKKKVEAEEDTGCWDKFCKLFDLNLLKDGVYLNILYGLSISMVAEMNFKLIIPFFLGNLGYTKRDIAMSLSLMACADIAARVIVPPILDKLTFSKRATLMVGSILVALCRSLLAEQTETIPLVTILIVHGFFRGMTLINSPLVLSEYASGDNFPAVLGLSMVSKGIFIVILGPLGGYIRDVTQSYPIYIHFQSLMIFSMVIPWSIELIFFNKNKKSSKTKSSKPEQQKETQMQAAKKN